MIPDKKKECETQAMEAMATITAYAFCRKFFAYERFMEFGFMEFA